jgi:acyl-CoA hydrolase
MKFGRLSCECRCRFLQQIAAGLLFAVALGLGAGCSGPKEAPLPQQAVVLVLGDSISAGHGLAREQSWVAQLAPLTGWQLVNGGVSGDTTQQGLARLSALLEEHRPAAVIIELGGNDMLRRLSTRETVKTLDAIIGEVRAGGARPVLMAIPAPSVAGAAFGSLSDAEFYAETAKRQQVPLIDEVVADVLSTPSLKLDQLHPNAEGHRELASRVVKKLRRLGLLTSQ